MDKDDARPRVVIVGGGCGAADAARLIGLLLAAGVHATVLEPPKQVPYPQEMVVPRSMPVTHRRYWDRVRARGW